MAIFSPSAFFLQIVYGNHGVLGVPPGLGEPFVVDANAAL